MVELLHVDPRVVATLDRAHDDAGARRVEQRERRRRLPRLVLVRVVAHDRRLRDAVVDPAIDAREASRRSRRRPGAGRRSAPGARPRSRRGLLAAAQQHDRACRTRRSVAQAESTNASEPSATTAAAIAITAAAVFESSTPSATTAMRTRRGTRSSCSSSGTPGTGETSTLTGVVGPNGGWPRSSNVTLFCSLGLIRSMVAVFTIGSGVFWIVSVILIPTSWSRRCSGSSPGTRDPAWPRPRSRTTSRAGHRTGGRPSRRCRCRADPSACRPQPRPGGAARARSSSAGSRGRSRPAARSSRAR